MSQRPSSSDDLSRFPRTGSRQGSGRRSFATRYWSGATSRCSARMEPTVRSPWIEPAIIAKQTRSGAFGLARLPQFPAADGIGRRSPAAGNGIFGCRDGRLKIGLRDLKRHRRPKERNDTGENPQRTAYLESTPGFAVSKDWMVVCAVLYEPVSGGDRANNSEFRGFFPLSAEI